MDCALSNDWQLYYAIPVFFCCVATGLLAIPVVGIWHGSRMAVVLLVPALFPVYLWTDLLWHHVFNHC